MRLLALDIGNSRIKAGLFIGEQLEWTKLLTFTDYVSAYLNFWVDKYAIEVIGYTNVNIRQFSRIVELGALSGVELVELTGASPSPIVNAYQSPETLGADRFAAAVGARKMAPDSALLTIDIGTAITYDYVDAENRYLGGGISPGMNLRFKALHQYTARLPLVKEAEEAPFVGRTTEDSIRSGVQFGLKAEVEGVIRRYQELAHPRLTTFLTGGGAAFFANDIQYVDYVSPNLVLEGIYHLVQYHKVPHA